MRTAYKVWSGVAAGVFCIVAVTDLSSSTTASNQASRLTTSVAPTTRVAPPSPSPVTAVAAAPVTPAAPVGELVTVTKVVDGDTIEVTGNRKVRFLGIDACEMSTKGGREAKEYLDIFAGVGEQVRLVADGARNTDDHGRLLRRVERDSGYTSPSDPYGNDIGTSIISHEAIGIYKGKNDASAAYLTELRERDDGPRDCSGAPEVPSSGGGSYGDGDDHDFNMPDGALTGGYCARKWWC